MTNLHWFLGCFGGVSKFPPFRVWFFNSFCFWGKLELNQKHLEFYLCTLSFISVPFGVSEQAARAVQFLVQLHVDLQVLVHSCSVDARLCCTQSLLLLQTLAGRQQSASNLGNTALDLQLFHDLFKPGCAALPNCPRPMSETRIEKNPIPASASDMNFGVQAFPKSSVCIWGNVPEPCPKS